MGGFSSNASTGSGGGSGPAGRKSDGSYGTKRDAMRASRRNEGRKAVKAVGDFIKGGGITGAVIRGVSKAFDPKRNRKSKSGDVYGYDEAKEKIDYKAPPKMNTGGGRDDNPKGIEVAKQTGNLTAETQMSAVDAAPDGPTNIEMPEETEAERLLRIKRQGRRATILNVPEEELTLSKKILLG